MQLPPERYNVATMLDANIDAGRADKVAIYCDDERVSYAQLLANSCRAGNALAELGVGREQRVLMVMSDRVLAARDVRKSRTSGTDAFAGFPRDAPGIARTARELDLEGSQYFAKPRRQRRPAGSGAAGGAAGGAMNLLQFPSLNHKCDITPGIMEPDCRSLLQTFFEKKRKPSTGTE